MTNETMETLSLEMVQAPGCCEPAAALRLSAADANSLAGALKALGHPVRLQIVDLLSRYAGRVCVCDVESQFSLSQPTISHHLKILREAGLVGAEQRGLWTYYYVRTDAVRSLEILLAAWTTPDSQVDPACLLPTDSKVSASA